MKFLQVRVGGEFEEAGVEREDGVGLLGAGVLGDGRQRPRRRVWRHCGRFCWYRKDQRPWIGLWLVVDS